MGEEKSRGMAGSESGEAEDWGHVRENLNDTEK